MMGQRSELKLEAVSARKRSIDIVPYMLSDMPSSTLASAKIVFEVSQPLSPADKKKQPCCALRMAGSNSRSAEGLRT